jgi:two-component system chemotaxis response regulator CheB
LTDRKKPGRPRDDVIAVAASAGGLRALSSPLSTLPPNFSPCVVVVQHVSPRHPSRLAEILRREAKRDVEEARDGDQLQPGRVYIAPPDQHLLINPDGTITLTHTELVHFVRPSADLLFESVAGAYGKRAIVVVLTGTGTDGSLGVVAAKKKGSRVIVQDEATSEFFGMPSDPGPPSARAFTTPHCEY